MNENAAPPMFFAFLGGALSPERLPSSAFRRFVASVTENLKRRVVEPASTSSGGWIHHRDHAGCRLTPARNRARTRSSPTDPPPNSVRPAQLPDFVSIRRRRPRPPRPGILTTSDASDRHDGQPTHHSRAILNFIAGPLALSNERKA